MVVQPRVLSESFNYMLPLQTKLSFKLWRNDDDWYLAELFCNDEHIGFTQGRNEEEIMEMVADCFMATYDIRCSWWNKFLSKLMIYREL